MAKGPRWWGFRDDYRHLHCYDPARGGHRLPYTFRNPPGEGMFWRCSRQLPDKHGLCDRWIYFCEIPEVGRVLEIEVHPHERKAIDELQGQGLIEPTSPAEILEYLGFRPGR